MASRKKTTETETTVDAVLAWLEQQGTQANVEGMARYAITAEKVFGVSVGDLRDYAKPLRQQDASSRHQLAAELWASGWYEARMLAAFVEDPTMVTAAQMDRWARDFDNWAICDHNCFHLFDRTPHAWRKVEQWATRRDEFVKRAAFALLASLSVHDKQADDAGFMRGLELIEAAADDERNFVKKGVNWALRSIGKRNLALHKPALSLASRLAESEHASARWVGKDALRELNSPAVPTRLRAKRGPQKKKQKKKQ